MSVHYKKRVNLWFQTREQFDSFVKLATITGLSQEDFVRHAVDRELHRVVEMIRAQLSASAEKESTVSSTEEIKDDSAQV